MVNQTKADLKARKASLKTSEERDVVATKATDTTISKKENEAVNSPTVPELTPEVLYEILEYHEKVLRIALRNHGVEMKRHLSYTERCHQHRDTTPKTVRFVLTEGKATRQGMLDTRRHLWAVVEILSALHGEMVKKVKMEDTGGENDMWRAAAVPVLEGIHDDYTTILDSLHPNLGEMGGH